MAIRARTDFPTTGVVGGGWLRTGILNDRRNRITRDMGGGGVTREEQSERAEKEAKRRMGKRYLKITTNLPLFTRTHTRHTHTHGTHTHCTPTHASHPRRPADSLRRKQYLRARAHCSPVIVNRSKAERQKHARVGKDDCLIHRHMRLYIVRDVLCIIF